MSAAPSPVPIAEPAHPEVFQASARSFAAAVVAVASTYVYFLIFAQFGFLKAVAEVEGEHLKVIMGIMGLCGVGASIGGAWLHREGGGKRLMGAGFALCAAAALLAMVAGNLVLLAVTSLLTGGGTGLITVTLATLLRREVGGARLGLCVGVGTGIAYGLCNVPAIFAAGVVVQASIALLACGAGAVAVWLFTQQIAEPVAGGPDYNRLGIAGWVAVFFALVWLDSSAFYVIQHTTELKSGTWEGGGQLYLNAFVHLASAVLAGLLLDRRLAGCTILLAAALLITACQLIGDGQGMLSAGAFCYAAGVSFYSTALVYYPAYSGRAGLAALVYAVAGWIGSALGIGMAENLGRIPPGFLVAAGAVVLGAGFLRTGLARKIRPGTGGWILIVALLAMVGRLRAAEAEAGRRVYIAEGCIHCHSQYVRPETADEDRYGPAHDLDELLGARPPLLGNRRQGPDLLNLALRRTREWNRAHLIAPRSLLPGSRMPSYRHLFVGNAAAGEALLDYLDTLRPVAPAKVVQK